MPEYIVSASRNEYVLKEDLFESPSMEVALEHAKHAWPDLGPVSWLAVHAGDYPEWIARIKNRAPPPAPQYGLAVKYRRYRCKNCGHVQSIQTNHTGECIDYCGRGAAGVEGGGKGGCSWKPSFGNPKHAISSGGQTYRPFECVEHEPEVKATSRGDA